MRRFCGTCGTDCDERGRRVCDCVEEPASHLARVVLAATRVAGPEADLEQLRRALRGASFHLRDRN